jgi:hypothetical protein
MKTWLIKNKEHKHRYDREYRKQHPDLNKKRKDYFTKYQQSHPEKARDRQKRYRKTEKGKINDIRVKSKRKRNLGFKPIIPNILDEKIVWHHIDDDNVVPIPRDLHLLYYGGHDTEKHRENIKPIIEQLYETKFD